MLIPTSHLVKIAYVSSIGLGGGFLTKKASQVLIWSWNRISSEKKKISNEVQEKILKYSEIIGGLFFAVLAGREVFSDNMIKKQIKILKEDLRNLEREVRDLFKTIYDKGKDAIRNFPFGKK